MYKIMFKLWTLLLFCMLISLYGMGQGGSDEFVKLNSSPVTFDDVVSRFEENNLDYVVLPLQGEAVVVVSQYGGRILGPFPSKSEPSIYWINPVFADSSEFKEISNCKRPYDRRGKDLDCPGNSI